MKKILLLLSVAALSALGQSCGPAEQGAAGPSGTDTAGLVMHFQQGVYPLSFYDGAEDTYIMNTAGQEDYNYGTCTELDIGTCNESRRSLFRFEIDGYLPENAVIISALLTLQTGEGEGAPVYRAYEPMLAWEDGPGCASEEATGASWVYPWTNPGGDYKTTAVSNSAAVEPYKKVVLQLSAAMVQKWLDTPGSNFGVIVLEQSGASSCDGAMIASAEAFDPALRPKLTVYYRLK